MSKIKLNYVIACAFILAFVVSSSAVKAQVDGMAGIDTVEDRAVVVGTVTKDITDRNNIFSGSYADGLTYELEGFSLRNGEIYDSSSDDDNNGYGNITFNPAYIINSHYNSSGLLKLDKWTETDANNELAYSIDYVDSNSKNSKGLAINYQSSNSVSEAVLSYSPTQAISKDMYLLFGMKYTDTLNNTAEHFRLSLFDANLNTLRIVVTPSATGDWTYGGGTVESINFKTGDGIERTILLCAQISHFDSLLDLFDFGSITKIELKFGRSTSAHSGSFKTIIFALDFIDGPAKAGISRENQLSSANDYVALNVTDPSYPYLKVRELDSYITRVNDAQIDFVYLPEAEEVYSFDEEQETYSVTYDYQIQIDVSDDWADEVSFSNMQLYYVLGADDSVYTSFIYSGNEKSSLLLNEEKGDAILLDNIVEDTIYLLRVEKALSQTEYDLAVGNASGNIFDTLYLALIALGIAILGFIPSVKHRLENKKREKLTEIKNRK